jgi:hypothetical protein
MPCLEIRIPLQHIQFDGDHAEKFNWTLYSKSHLTIEFIKDKQVTSITARGDFLGDNSPDYRELFEKIMILMRLYTHGNILGNGFEVFIDGCLRNRRVLPYMIPWGPILFSNYTLDSSDEDYLAKLFQDYFDTLDISNTSLHWFAYAPFRYMITDRLVDYVISLESIFVEYLPDKRGERKKDNVMERGSIIVENLGYGPGYRPTFSNWIDFINKSYDCRNRIVHGAKKEDQPPIEEVINLVRDLEIMCRAVIKRLLKDGTLYDWNLRRRRYSWRSR